MIQSQSFMAKSNFEWLVSKFLPKFLGIIHAKSHFLMVNSEVFRLKDPTWPAHQC